HRHALQAFLPALDDLRQRERGRFAPAPAGVELLVGAPDLAGVVDGQRVARLDRLALTLDERLDDELLGRLLLGLGGQRGRLVAARALHLDALEGLAGLLAGGGRQRL